MRNAKDYQYLTYTLMTLMLVLAVTMSYQVLRQAQIHRFHADKLFKQGRFVEAAERYTMALAKGLESPAMLRRLGDAYMASGEFAKAVPVFSHLVRLDPSNLVAMLKLAGLYALQHKTDDALELVENVLQKYPDWRIARIARARIFTMAGRFDEAITDYRFILHENTKETQ